ncbi:hypothetical protein DFP72DRAFT_1076226 [Ephemerocybe angulata]|uniref:Uncharacterized protein n=1 Tax=Ephemerocybe angulata TaxID=980116 RepID=A0A8H6HGS8_9AGAR|nr:hypothetical protein DFP72DRAFT_1076226 [Tulosesus angulatus]
MPSSGSRKRKGKSTEREDKKKSKGRSGTSKSREKSVEGNSGDRKGRGKASKSSRKGKKREESRESSEDGSEEYEEAASENEGGSESGEYEKVFKSDLHCYVLQAGKKVGGYKKGPFWLYRKFAGFNCRAINMFASWREIFDVAIRVESETWTSIADNEELGEDRFWGRYKKEIQVVEAMKARIPGFVGEIPILAEDPEYFDAFVALMDEAHMRAKSNDIAKLRDRGIEYLASLQPGGVITPPLKAASTKSKARGHNHPLTSRLLCPMKFYKEYQKNPDEMRKKLKKGDKPYRTLGRHLLTFMYDENKIDMNDREAGLLESDLIVMVYQAIFMGPSAATATEGETPRPSKRGQAALNMMDYATLGSIAYAVLHTYWFICATNDWRDDDYPFDRKAMYDTIMALDDAEECEDDPTSSWTFAITEFYNMRALPHRGQRGTDDVSDDEGEAAAGMTDLAVVRAQRQAKRDQKREISPTVALSSRGGSAVPQDFNAAEDNYVQMEQVVTEQDQDGSPNESEQARSPNEREREHGGEPYARSTDQRERGGEPYAKSTHPHEREHGGEPYARSTDQRERGGEPYAKSTHPHEREHGGEPYARFTDQRERGGEPYARSTDQRERGGEPYAKSTHPHEREHGGEPYARFTDQRERGGEPYARFTDQRERGGEPYAKSTQPHERERGGEPYPRSTDQRERGGEPYAKSTQPHEREHGGKPYPRSTDQREHGGEPYAKSTHPHERERRGDYAGPTNASNTNSNPPDERPQIVYTGHRGNFQGSQREYYAWIANARKGNATQENEHRGEDYSHSAANQAHPNAKFAATLAEQQRSELDHTGGRLDHQGRGGCDNQDPQDRVFERQECQLATPRATSPDPLSGSPGELQLSMSPAYGSAVYPSQSDLLATASSPLQSNSLMQSPFNADEDFGLEYCDDPNAPDQNSGPASSATNALPLTVLQLDEPSSASHHAASSQRSPLARIDPLDAQNRPAEFTRLRTSGLAALGKVAEKRPGNTFPPLWNTGFRRMPAPPSSTQNTVESTTATNSAPPQVSMRDLLRMPPPFKPRLLPVPGQPGPSKQGTGLAYSPAPEPLHQKAQSASRPGPPGTHVDSNATHPKLGQGPSSQPNTDPLASGLDQHPKQPAPKGGLTFKLKLPARVQVPSPQSQPKTRSSRQSARMPKPIGIAAPKPTPKRAREETVETSAKKKKRK